MSRILFCCLLLCLNHILVCHAASLPGFKAAVTQPGLDYAVKVTIRTISLPSTAQVGVPLIQKALPNVAIPNQSGDAHVPVLGHIDYSLSNMHLTDFSLGGASIKLVAGKGLTLHISSLSLAMNVDWHWKREHFPKASSHGMYCGCRHASPLTHAGQRRPCHSR